MSPFSTTNPVTDWEGDAPAEPDSKLSSAAAVLRSADLSPPRLFCFVLLLIGATGCSGIPQKQDNGFLKPIASAELPPESKRRRQPMPSERSLCIETAKTVSQRGHVEEAIKLYQRAEELGASQAPLDKELAPLLGQVGDFSAAVERYQRLVAGSPNDSDLCNNFAWTLMEAERYGEAVTQAQRGLTLDPENKRLRTTMAMVRYRQGDRISALAEFAKAQDTNAAHHNLGVLDIDAGNIDSAQQHLRQASEVLPSGLSRASPKTEAILAALDQHTNRQQPVQR